MEQKRQILKNQHVIMSVLAEITKDHLSEKLTSACNVTIQLLEKDSDLRVKERTFNQSEIEKLQHEVYKITGKGEVMGLFNQLLGNNAT